MPIGEEDNNLWNKLKKENNNIKEKYRRINRRRYITSREYIDSTKNIQLLRFIRKNKIEKLNNLISIKNSEIDTLNSNILAKEASGIFEQIRKKAEDISTSEGSYGFFYNLSNPTNLTNPQIVAVRTVDSNLYNSDAKQNNILYKFKAKNKSRQYKYNINYNQSNRNELI